MTEFTDEFVLRISETPPSFNKVGHSGNRWTWTREKKQWQENIELMLLFAQVPKLSRVEVRAELSFPARRRRDEGNYRTLLEKVVGDALVGDPRVWPEGRFLPDDTPDRYSFGRVEFMEGEPETKLFLRGVLSS